MIRRKRTAKTVGQRHDLNYFKAWTPSRKWRFALIAAFCILGLAWFLSSFMPGRQAAFSKGPLSRAHSIFGKQCSTCHVNMNDHGELKTGFKNVASDAACLSCHDAPSHQKTLTFTPTCGSCHVEHRGVFRLTHMEDMNCVQCHKDIATYSTANSVHIENVVLGFNTKHPEFAPLREGEKDPGTIRLNHSVHMKAGLRGPNGQLVNMECSDCHRTPADAQRPWHYSEAGLKPPPRQDHEFDLPNPDTDRAHMEPPAYARTCFACHTLEFDTHIKEYAPHDKPEVVHKFIIDRLKEYIARHPEALRQTRSDDRYIPGQTSIHVAHTTPSEWVEMHTKDAEQILFRKTCKLCHQMDYRSADGTLTPQALPKVVESRITLRWFPKSVFSHQAHMTVTCESCHAKALTSTQTEDILLPGIKTCQTCHNGRPNVEGVSENGCFLCHTYHKWDQRKDFKGKYTIHQLTGSLIFNGVETMTRSR